MPESSAVGGPDFAALRLHLRRLRTERGLSYTELASRADVGRATLINLESGFTRRGKSRPETVGTVETWYKIAVALNVDLGDLLRPLYGKD